METYIRTIFSEDKHPDDDIDDSYREDGTHYSNYYTNDRSSIIITGTYTISTNAMSHMLIYRLVSST